MVIKYWIVVLISAFILLANDTYGEEKFCRFMNPEYGIRIQNRNIWNHVTGLFCYFYISPARLHFKYGFTNREFNGSLIPGSLVENGTKFLWYDYKNETSLHYVKASFLNDIFFEKWRTCAREAADCCDHFMSEENIYPTEEYPCPAVWDSWTCFAPAKAGTTAKQLCPEITYSSQSRSCELTSEKQCFSNGTWIYKTNYDTCALAPTLRGRHNFNIIVLAIAAVFSFPSLLILFGFRNLRQKLQFVLHRNLILIIVLRNLLSIMSKEIIIMDELRSSETETVMSGNGVACRVLAFFENVAKNGIFGCMLADGFYLHRSIVRPFVQEPSMVLIYGTVSVLSLVPSVIWATLRGLHDGQDCWMVDNSQDHWVTDGFRLVILGINALLLIDIIRVMVLKLKRGGITQQTKTTVRVTLFLIPLFGTHIIIISNRNIVTSNTCAAHDVYYYASYLLEAFQGIMVSILFCYINAEVRREISNGLRKVTVYLQQKFDWGCSKEKKFKRRATTATFVGSFSESNS